MKDLPKEVLFLISSHLRQRDQLNCLLVCKYWYDAFSNTLHRVVILDKRDKFDNAFTLFNGKRNLDNFSALALPALFPKLSYLTWDVKISDHSYKPRKDVYTRQFKKWNNLLKATIVINEKLSIANYLLDSTVFEKLCVLEVEFSSCNNNYHYYQDSGPNNSSSLLKSLITAFKNTPLLGSLNLTGFTVGLNDVEDIHKTALHLYELELERTTLLLRSNIDNITTENGISSMLDKDRVKTVIDPAIDDFSAFKLTIVEQEMGL